ncbi:hypothetical protein LJB79_00465 [Bacteroides sp. OttesenSCG-928-M17]|nr:hypothetical protein [Bacteroides sp. OttesenSCG-928-M17]
MRENLPDNNVIKLIEQYEAARAENKTIYMDSDDYCDITSFYLENKKIEEASEAVNRALSIHPDNMELRSDKVSILLYQNEVKKAWEIIKSFEDQNDFLVRLTKIEFYAFTANVAEGKKLLKTISFEEVEDDEDTVQNILYAYHDLELYEEAINWLGEVIPQKVLQNPEIAEIVAKCLTECNRQKEAIDIYNRLLDDAPYSETLWVQLAKSLSIDSQHEKAIEACDFALVINENNVEVRSVKGNTLYQLEEYEAAIKEYEKIRDKDPECYDTFIAFCYVSLEEYEKAYDLLNDSIEAFDLESELYPYILLNYVKCLIGMGEEKEALEYSQKMHEAYPDFEQGEDIYLEMLAKEKKLKELLDFFLETVDPDNPDEVWFNVAVSTYHSGYRAESLSILKKIEKGLSEEFNVSEYLMLAYYHTGDTENYQRYKEKFLSEGEEGTESLADFPDEELVEVLEYILKRNLEE